MSDLPRNLDFPVQTPLVRRTLDFHSLADITDWVGAGSSTTFPVVQSTPHGGQLQLQLNATSGQGFCAFLPPASVFLGKGTYLRSLWHVNLTPALNADFAIGLAEANQGWLGGSNYIRNGIILKKESGDYNLDFVCASGNGSPTYPTETANKTDVVRLLGSGWAVLAFDIVTDQSQIGCGSVRLSINGLTYHTQQLTRIPYSVGLCPVIGLVNGENVSKLLSLDLLDFEYGRYTVTNPAATFISGSGGSGGGGSSRGGDLGQGSGGSVGNGSNCVARGTIITMADGTSLPVEQLVAGMTVQSPLGDSIVTSVNECDAEPCVTVSSFTGESLTCTPRHSIMCDGQQIAASELEPGMPLSTTGGVSAVRLVENSDDAIVYKLEIKGHLFFANGVLTHNDKHGGGNTSTTLTPGTMPT